MRARLPLVTALVVAAVAAACTSDERAIGPGDDRLVVHAVLDPQRTSTVLQLERLLSGAVAVDTGLAYDSTDAIASRGGVPVSGARVVIVSETGDSAVAVEDLVRRGDGRGAGMYRFRTVPGIPEAPGDDAIAVVTGLRYDLRIETTDGRVARGSTLVPAAAPVTRFTVPQPFDRTSDSIFVFWEEAPSAARYLLRVESPYGAFRLFVDSAEYLVAGALRNPDLPGLPAVFMPGFTQVVSVGAVDRNFFDYYRSANDPFTGTGVINHLEGALGVFGSHVLLHLRSLAVDAPRDPASSIEGDWQRTAGTTAAPGVLRLWVDTREGAVSRISGHWLGSASADPPGIVGTADGLRASLAILRGQSARDTAMVLDLNMQGTVMTGRVRGTEATVEYRRR